MAISGLEIGRLPRPYVDLKELVVSIGGYRYVIFAIDEHSRYVFIDFMKLKSDVLGAVKRIIAAFDATVGTPIDETGRALPRPRVREIDSDREGKLMSQLFLEVRADAGIHHTTSPPHDHDLNPIAERIIGLISETASAVRARPARRPATGLGSSRMWSTGTTRPSARPARPLPTR